MKPCVIKQPAGIGDIFFCQKIAHYMVHHGYDVIWPLRPDIEWIGDYIKGYGIEFPTTEDDFVMKDIYDKSMGYVIQDTGAFISTATADITNNDGKTMSSKYSMLGMEYDDWSKYFLFQRNLDKENDLYYNVLGLDDNSEFAFISNLYNTDIRDSKFISKDQFDIPVVELMIIDGFTLFDWCKVLEKANLIYTVTVSYTHLTLPTTPYV